MTTISWQEFEQVDLRVGSIVTAEVFRRPADPPSSCTWISVRTSVF